MSSDTQLSPGEVVAWVASKSIKHTDLVDALRASDLPEKLARAKLPRHAFARAARRMSEQRIIRRVAESGDAIEFQFTREHLDSGEARFQYDYEAILRLDKKSGRIACPDAPALVRVAQAELDKAMEERTAADLTRLIQRVFEGKDLFAIRPQGGCYFVPSVHRSFVDKVAAFVSLVGVDLRRFPVGSSPEGHKAIRSAVAEGLAGVVREHAQAVESFADDAREGTLDRAGQRIAQTEFKIEMYAQYLDDQKQALLDELAKARAALKRKIEAAAAAEVGV